MSCIKIETKAIEREFSLIHIEKNNPTLSV